MLLFTCPIKMPPMFLKQNHCIIGSKLGTFFCNKAIEYNPYSYSSYLEKMETYHFEKNKDEMIKLITKFYDNVYFSYELARYYSDLGYYYIEVKKYDLVYVLYLLSNKLKESTSNYYEMEYIKQKLNVTEYNIKQDDKEI